MTDALLPEAPATPGGVLTRRTSSTPFEVHLDVFEGPFDLLLGLIAKHKLDITEIALARVTDEFIGHIRTIREADEEWDLSQASEFLLVAATLLDIKAARLLPQVDPDDEEDLALIEARDLLFARLLQYRAFKDVAATVVKNAKPLAWLVTSAAKFDQYRIMREASSTASTMIRPIRICIGLPWNSKVEPASCVLP